MKTKEIKAVSYVHAGGKLVCTDDLDAGRKKQLGIWIKTAYLGNLYRGQLTPDTYYQTRFYSRSS